MKMYTMDDWKNDGSLNLKEGQLVADEVIFELRDCVPPKMYQTGIFQVGEPKDADAEELGVNLYDTFVRCDEGWKFIGMCRGGETTPRQGYCSNYLKLS